VSTLIAMPSTRGLRVATPVRLALPACAATLVLLALMLAAAPRAEARSGLEMAMQDDAVFVPGARNPYNRDKAYQQIAKFKTSWLRINVLWAYVAAGHANDRNKPADPQYVFTHIDDAIDAAAARGIRVQLAISGPPPRWANGRKASPFGSKDKGYKPNTAEFGNFVRIVAAHFKGRIGRVLVYNEGNHDSWIKPLKKGPSIYRNLYTQAYNAVKQVDPSIQVLFGVLAPHKSSHATAPLAFLRSAACVTKSLKRRGNCQPLRLDGFAQHTYDFDNPPNKRRKNPDDITMASLNNLTKVLDRLQKLKRLVRNGGGKIDIWVTEYGQLLKRSKRSGRGFDEKTRAKYIVQAFQMGYRHKRVRQMLQYLLVTPGGRSAFFNTAVLDRKGREGPTFKALRKWAGKRRLARPLSPFTLPPAGGGGNPSSPPSSGGGDGGGGLNPLCPPVCTP
jgi:hypothetical protein